MIEWTISIGAIGTGLLVLLTFIGSGVLNTYSLGRYTGALQQRLTTLDERMAKLEAGEEKMALALIKIAEQNVRLDGISNRVDDVQRYGSHRMTEVLDAMRTQLMTEIKERFLERG